MKTELEKFSDQMALMEMCVQLEDEQNKIFDALPKLKDEFSKEAKSEFARLTKQAEAIEWKLAEARGEYLKTVEANRAEFARMEQSIKAKGTELAEYSKRLQYEVPAPVEQKIKAIFETLPRPANGKDGVNGKDASLLTGFRGNWDSDTTYKAGDWFTFRGSSYLVLRACKGQIPTKNAQGEPGAYYAVFAMSGAPGPNVNGLYLPTGGGTLTGALKIDVASTVEGLWNVGKTRLDGLVGIGVAPQTNISLTIAATLTPSVDTVYGMYGATTAAPTATGSLYQFYTNPRTAAAVYTLGTLCHYRAAFPSIGAGSSITTQEGFTAGSGIVGATNNYGFRGMLAAASGRWNLYMDGTAQNYIAGVTGIGVAASATAALGLAASVAGVASLRIPHGTAPSSPVDGDIWTTTAGLFVRVNGVTVGPLAA